MGFLSANLRALRERQPLLAAVLQDAPSLTPHLVSTPDGGAAVRLHGDTGPWVCSRRAPRQEAERLAEKLELPNLAACVMIGGGLGHSIEAVNHRYPESQIIVLEEHLPLIRAGLELLDCSSLIRAGRLVFVLDLPGASAFDNLEKCGESVRTWGYRVLTHAYTTGIERYVALFAEFGSWVRMTSLKTRTDMLGVRYALETLMRNLPHYLLNPGLEEFRGILKGVPGVLVGAGPSLQRNLHVLKDYVGNAFIHVVSTAIRRVANEGIPINSVNVIDFSHLSERYISHIPGEQPPLWTHPRCNAKVLDAWQGAKIVCDDTVYRDMFGDVAPHHDFYDDGGTNVAHYGYQALRLMGCDPIIGCGLDQAYSFHVTHIPGTPIHDEWAASAHRFMSLELQELMFMCSIVEEKDKRVDVYGNPLYTDGLMEASAVEFETFFARNTDTTFINATEGGRPLRGAKIMSLRAALDAHANKQADLRPFRKVFEKSGDRSVLLPKGLEVLRRARAYGDKLRDIFARSRKALVKAERVLLGGKHPEGTEALLDRMNEKLNEWRGIYNIVHNLATSDSYTRKRLDALIRDEAIPEHERFLLLARREQIFIEGLEKALETWQEVLEIGQRRLEGCLTDPSVPIACPPR